MKNIEQIRALNALEAAKGLERSAVNKLPAMIITNGLLATAAFCSAEGSSESRKGMQKALKSTIEHLKTRKMLSNDVKTIENMIEELSKRDSHHLQQVTAEALAFISYLKRFAEQKKD